MFYLQRDFTHSFPTQYPTQYLSQIGSNRSTSSRSDETLPLYLDSHSNTNYSTTTSMSSPQEQIRHSASASASASHPPSHLFGQTCTDNYDSPSFSNSNSHDYDLHEPRVSYAQRNLVTKSTLLDSSHLLDGDAHTVKIHDHPRDSLSLSFLTKIEKKGEFNNNAYNYAFLHADEHSTSSPMITPRSDLYSNFLLNHPANIN